MDIVVHDFSGHPFQAELSRHLAGSGHQVTHVSAKQYVSGKGELTRQPGDAEGLSFVEIELDLPFQKYAPLGRARWELAYGRAWVRRLRASRPDVVIMCNVPLIAMLGFVWWARRQRVPWVFWHQDIYAYGMAGELHRRLPGPLARLGARLLERLEAWSARNASHVVAIGDAFTAVYPQWRVPASRVSVIPNWAPLDRIVPTERENRRSLDVFGEGDALRLLYAGTLGRKHNPLLLVELARTLAGLGVDSAFTVVSEGEGANELQAAIDADPTVPLRILPFQPSSDLSEVLGSADVLVALLEPDATRFSIPSKVLSYMAAGRPIVGLMPDDNPAAVDIVEAGGHVGQPTSEGVTDAAAWLEALTRDPEAVERIGHRTRALAEARFDLDSVGERFTTILQDAVTGSPAQETARLPRSR